MGWARAVCAMQVFDGVHLDVEPWARTDWDTRRAEVVAGYVDVLRRLAATCPLRLEVDLAVWLHQVPTASDTPLDEAVMRLVDAVTLLAFRNLPTGPDSIIEIARVSLTRPTGLASRAASPSRPTTSDRNRCSASRPSSDWVRPPWSEPSRWSRREASRVPAYVGMAVHDVDGWNALEAAPVTRPGGGGA